MARSVVLKKSVRCPRCHLSPRWCICEGGETIECPVQVDVLMHYMEAFRPSSTGHLIKRVIPASGLHRYRYDLPLDRATIAKPDRTRWILHPLGEPMPANETPSKLQVLLLDGTWRQSADMAHAVEPWGRKVSLPMTGESRFWLRSQSGEGKFSTVEALLFLLAALGLRREEAALRLQFELHVFAGLRARGKKALAEQFLATSPMRDAMPALLEKLAARRPRTDFPATENRG